MKKMLPIGNDSFRTVREQNWYYVDKSLMIKEFIELQNTVALITRPRRFGKTLNITMIREFFDITKDSSAVFHGLAIMETEYAGLINKTPVIYFSFKDCTGADAEYLKFKLSDTVFNEYKRYYKIFYNYPDKQSADYQRFIMLYESMLINEMSWELLSISIITLENMVTEYFGIKPIVLIDEYDQPIMSSYEHNYHHKLNDFFSGFYGSALKGQDNMSCALLTGIQRVAKESIFSKLNNIIVYTVLDKSYAPYFGLNREETKDLLEYYELELNDEVKNQYNGYLFDGTPMYNPWSIINYANKKVLASYWINTSTNRLIRNAIFSSGDLFREEFEILLSKHSAAVGATLETSYLELENSDTLWGLLINAGYLTVLEQKDELYMSVAIPNGEVRTEFQKIIAEQSNISGRELKKMFYALSEQDMEEFLKIYSRIVLSCTSYFDAKENAYHMLFLGMCISLKDLYKITSNIESGHGRSDITMESLFKNRFHVIVEFKQGKDISRLKEEALNQIIENQYFSGLTGKVLCIGLAHNKKHCEIAYKMIDA